MILATRLALRDLRGGLSRFMVLILCLALGIAAIAAVDTVSRGIAETLREDGRTMLGGDLSVRSVYQPADQAARNLLAGYGTVSESASMRAMVRSGDEATLVELKAVGDAYPLYGSVDLSNGTLADALAKDASGAWGVAVEPGVLERLGLKIGDSLMLGQGRYVVRATISRSPDAASGSAFVLGPRVLIARDSLEGAGLIQSGTLVYWDYAVRLPPGGGLAATSAALHKFGADRGWQVKSFDEAAPGLERLLGRLTQFMTLIGVSSLVVGGIGIANAVSAAIEQRLGVIATMKCIGGTRDVVFATFLIETLLVAMIGIFIGIVIGMGVPLALRSQIAAVLPVAPRLHATGEAVAASVFYGLLVTLLFALPALFQTGTVSPAALFRSRVTSLTPRYSWRQMTVIGCVALVFLALLLWRSPDKHLTGNFLFGLSLTMLVFSTSGEMVAAAAGWARRRVSWPAELKLALANLSRPGNRTRGMTLSIGIGLSVLVTVGLVEANFRHELATRISDKAPSFFFLDVQKDQFDDFRQAVLAVPGTEDFQATPSLRGRIATVNGLPAETRIRDKRFGWVLGSDRGITYSAELPKGSRLIKGDWWKSGEPAGEPRLSITQEIANAFAIGPGDHMSVNIAGRDIAGRVENIREVSWGSFNINFTIVFAPGTLEPAPQTWLATVRADPVAAKALEHVLTRRFPNVSVVDVREVIGTLNEVMGKIATAIRLASLVVLCTGVLVLLGAVSAGNERRVSEAVVMKVVGATRARLFALFLLEYGSLGLAAALVAIVVGIVAAYALTVGLFGLEWHLYPRPALLAAGGSLAITLLVGFGATLLALGRKSAPYLRAE